MIWLFSFRELVPKASVKCELDMLHRSQFENRSPLRPPPFQQRKNCLVIINVLRSKLGAKHEVVSLGLVTTSQVRRKSTHRRRSADWPDPTSIFDLWVSTWSREACMLLMLQHSTTSPTKCWLFLYQGCVVECDWRGPRSLDAIRPDLFPYSSSLFLELPETPIGGHRLPGRSKDRFPVPFVIRCLFWIFLEIFKEDC